MMFSNRKEDDLPLTSITKDPQRLTMTIIGDYKVSQQRLWEAWEDPRQLERFWGPPFAPSTFTRHEFKAGGRSEYYLMMNGEKWPGSWKFITVSPISFFEAEDGDGDVENGPASMTVEFATTATGSRMTCITTFASVEAMERVAPGMEEGLRASLPQLDVIFAALG